MSNRSINNAGRVQNANFGDNFGGIVNQGAGSVDASTHWHNARITQQTVNIAGNQYQFVNVRWEEDLIRRFNPILDASHTRNRKRSPPDSECFPGTRQKPIQEVIVWADSGDMSRVCTVPAVFRFPAKYRMKRTPHIYWLHGFAGCGKSSISLEVAKIYAGSGRLLASYFFFRGAGDRSTMNRFAVTLASQLVAAVPAVAPLVQAAVRAEPGLVTGHVSLAKQLDLLILSPLQTVIDEGALGEILAKGPFLIVIDGLDECKDKRGVEEFIDHMLSFFEKHPSIPLRFFIASRVEQHIRERLETDGVQLGNLDSHSAHNDIEAFLQASFQAAAKRDRVICAYVRAHGEWPAKLDMNELIEHIGGSFVLASTIFKFIVQPATTEDPLTPMERLPLTLEMNGLDGLYAQILARSQHLPHFHNVISAIAVLRKSLSIVGIAEVLGIQAFEVVRVLLNLQGIVHVPGSDEEGKVTLCHTSLRDFLVTERRSGSFFAPPLFHLQLSYYCFASDLKRGSGLDNVYGRRYFHEHLHSIACSEACDFINEIERFKAHQSPLVDVPPYHAFLCTVFFSIVCRRFSISDRLSYILTECAKHLVLAVECPDSRIRFWLEEGYVTITLSLYIVCEVQFTEQTYEAVQQHLRRALTAIHAKFPELVGPNDRLTGTEQKHRICVSQLAGMGIFRALEWIVLRAHFVWEEAEILPRTPLTLSIFRGWKGDIFISLDGVKGDN